MLILSFDSTANTASVALSENGRLLSLYTVCGHRTHSETLLPMAEDILAKSGKTMKNVDLFAVSRGPGSFTGVRIGVATVKGLAFSSEKPCVGVSTLEALSENLNGLDSMRVPVMDARRNQVYTAIFDKNGKRLSEDMLVSLDKLSELLKKYNNKKICLVGDGYEIAKDYFRDDPRFIDTPSVLIPQNAFSVAAVAKKIYDAADDKSAFTDRTLSPGYLRASQAERERLEREKK